MPVFQLTPDLLFPPPHLACEDGLLAVGGDLYPERLLLAYSKGIFPWFSEADPILWWAPSPRLVLFPDELQVSRRLSRKLRQGRCTVTMDEAFPAVISACASIQRPGGQGTWITENMIDAYCRLHEIGHAHSVEVWRGDDLVGGMYGIALGGVFFGESMFSKESESSKIALYYLVQQLKKWDFDVIDCQVRTNHLVSLGAREIPGREFFCLLEKSIRKPGRICKWLLEKNLPLPRY